MAKAAFESVRMILVEALGDQLLALYRFGEVVAPDSGRAEIDPALLAVVAEDADLHHLREAFLPVWDEVRESVRRVPLIASCSAFRRHLLLFPLFAEHLAQSGERLAGRGRCTTEPVQAAAGEQVAYLAYEALQASRVLAPNLISAEQARVDRARLFRLARRLTGDTLPDSTPALLLFGRIQEVLHELVASLPDQERVRPVQPLDPADQSGLQAIYRETDHTVFILSELSPSLLQETAWEQLSERLQAENSSLQVTTANQLQLIVRYETALEFALGRYEHRWGSDPLAELEVPLWAVWRDAGRHPSRLLIDDVPAAYLTAPDEEAVHRVVHDYHNRLLNMGLQHELLHRLHQVEAAAPPASPPGRDQPLDARIESLLGNLGWWAEYYLGQMQATEMSETISAP